MKFRPSILSVLLVAFSVIICGLLGTGGFVLSILSARQGAIGPSIFTFVLAAGFYSLNWLAWKSIKDKIQVVVLDQQSISIFKPLINKRIESKIGNIKGYSRSLDDKSYGGGILKKRLVTIYFKERFDPIEVVQYQTRGVRQLETELRKMNIAFLGEESIHRDMWGQRTKFEYEKNEPLETWKHISNGADDYDPL